MRRMTTNFSTVRVLALAMATLLIALPAAWSSLALWYRAPGGPTSRKFILAIWIALTLTIVAPLWQGRSGSGLLLFALAFAGILCWWQRIPASNQRLWADDVSQIAHGSIDGDLVTLHNVRNFEWRTNTEYTQRWETRVYDLNRLHSMDMVMSYWTISAVAHMLMSFGFGDGQQVVFSVEIRRKLNQKYSEVGGFFKDFELSIIAADERDAIRVRTNVRREEAYLYRIRMSAADMRSLFIGYVGEANSLVGTPRFYNTITANCTTLVYPMVKRIVGYLPLDYRLLFVGYLPEYVYKVHGMDQRHSLAELRALGRVTERARLADRSADFSADIRRGIPDLETESTQ